METPVRWKIKNREIQIRGQRSEITQEFKSVEEFLLSFDDDVIMEEDKFEEVGVPNNSKKVWQEICCLRNKVLIKHNFNWLTLL